MTGVTPGNANLGAQGRLALEFESQARLIQDRLPAKFNRVHQLAPPPVSEVRVAKWTTSWRFGDCSEMEESCAWAQVTRAAVATMLRTSLYRNRDKKVNSSHEMTAPKPSAALREAWGASQSGFRRRQQQKAMKCTLPLRKLVS